MGRSAGILEAAPDHTAAETPIANAPDEPATLAVEGVCKRWPQAAAPVLADIDVQLGAGCVLTLSGANGAGKTTLLRIVAGMIAPDAGRVRVDGLDPESERVAFQRRVGFLAAGNSGLYARLKAEHHLELWSRLALMPKDARTAAVDSALRAFDLTPLLGRRVDRLSMGQRQRLRLALAFLHGPSLVLLDEPSTSLDEDGVAVLQRALDDLRGRGGCAVVCMPSGWESHLDADLSLRLERGRLEAA